MNLLKFSYLYFMVSIACNLFTCYIVILMLYVVVSLTSKEANMDMKDTILGRRVPQIVYINNLRLLKKSVEREKDKLAHDALKRQELRACAQMNEFMFAMLRKNDISSRIIENIGSIFFNMEMTAGILSERDDSLQQSLITSPFNESDASTD